MALSSRVQLIIGGLTTATVAVISYLFLRRRTESDKQRAVLEEPTNKQTVEVKSTVSGKDSEGVPDTSNIRQELFSQERQNEIQGDILDREGQNQSSYIVIDDAEQPENDRHQKKSDRSSDDSSYDVIDDEQLVEAVEEDAENGDSEKDVGRLESDNGSDLPQLEHELLTDTNETSMVVIEELDNSGASKSESSLYASADEQVELSGKQEDTSEAEPSVLDESTIIDASITADTSISLLELKEDEDTLEQLPESERAAPLDSTVNISEESRDKDPSPHSAEGSYSQFSVKLDNTSDLSTAVGLDLTTSDITDVLNSCQNSPGAISKQNVRNLAALLSKRIPELHSTVLNCVLRVAAFTQNVVTLQETGSFGVVAEQVVEACQDVSSGGLENEAMLNSLCQVLTNLTLDPKYQVEFKSTVPPLIGVLLSSSKEQVQLSVLRPLINFSSQSTYHAHYIPAISELFRLLDTGTHIARVQSLKVLVNLSLNDETVPSLLAAKAPASLLDLLNQPPTPTDLTLRVVTLLANIEATVNRLNLTLASLPTEDKAASPETMYIAVHGVDRISELRSKVFRLTRHGDEDVSAQASKLYQYIQGPSN